MAELAKVSPRTVSRVVNKESGYSKATEKRVLEAISELRYRPNLMAKGLITDRSDTIALIVTAMDNPFFAEFAHSIQLAARERGKATYLASSDNSLELEEQHLDRMASQAIDGAILFPVATKMAAPVRYASEGIPIVSIDTEIDHPNASYILSDLQDGVRQAVDHFKQQGRQRLVMLSASNLPTASRRREQAFKEACKNIDAKIVEVDPSYTGGLTAMTDLLKKRPSFDGVFAYNDLIAIGAMKGIIQAGYRVPEDIAVIGCDDIEMSSLVTPSLTSICFDRTRVSEEALTRVIELSKREETTPSTTIPVSLAIRDSSSV